MNGVLPLCPFPPLHWWYVANGDDAKISLASPFEKQTLRNRIIISGPHGRQVITFSIQHLDDDCSESILLSNHIPSIQSWRSVQTAYGNSPFYLHFEPELKKLWHEGLPRLITDRKSLGNWCIQTINWSAEQIGWTVPEATNDRIPFEGAPFDLRVKSKLRGEDWTHQRYAQPFEPKNGFIPGCSILDALFILGPQELKLRLNELVQPPQNLM
ncbi:MAG: WbqC family protein [Flavobacteriales bacterium]